MKGLYILLKIIGWQASVVGKEPAIEQRTDLLEVTGRRLRI
jgi:hypothetical protein